MFLNCEGLSTEWLNFQDSYLIQKGKKIRGVEQKYYASALDYLLLRITAAPDNLSCGAGSSPATSERSASTHRQLKKIT